MAFRELSPKLQLGKWGITGDNSSGKSTLLKLIAGLIALGSGSIQRNAIICYSEQEPQIPESVTLKNS